MKNIIGTIIITVLVIVSLLSISVLAQVGPENPNDPYTFDDFKKDFAAHPLLAAEAYPS